MLKIEALIQPFKLEEITAALGAIGIEEFSISDVLKRGGRSARKAVYRGAVYSVATPMVKLEILISAEQSDDVIRVFSDSSRANRWPDDGTLVIYELTDAMRIRTGARLEYALP